MQYGAEIEIGKSILEYQTAEAERNWMKLCLERALQGEQFSAESFSSDEISSRVYYEVSFSPVKASGGQVIGVAVLGRDITGYKRVEESLRKSDGPSVTSGVSAVKSECLLILHCIYMHSII